MEINIKNNCPRRGNCKGFTLIEILIAIAVIGIIASIILVNISIARQKAKVSAYKSQAVSIQTQAALACSSAGITIGGNVKYPEFNNYVGNMTLAGGSNCGTSGNITFRINTQAINTGSSACEAANSTAITQSRVDFPDGC